MNANSLTEAEIPAQESLTANESSLLKAMMEVGMFYGLNRSKTNPKNRPYIAFTKSGVEVIDVVKAIRALDEAAQAIKNEISSGGSIILVGTTPTKKEVISLERELEKLDRFFSGIETMEKLPGLIIIFNLKNHEIAAREASKMNIKSIGFLNTNADPDLVDYPIIVNDKNPKSIDFMASYLENIVEEAKRAKEAAALAIDSLSLGSIGDNG
ncbi:MAG: 30S ribosomal protein S2 [Candidatus Colwellbacteria bacterium]|nr:30S ribosomal protein S2 [Candidatus Colwellbacteria bacterium]